VGKPAGEKSEMPEPQKKISFLAEYHRSTAALWSVRITVTLIPRLVTAKRFRKEHI
jgi:hypothetical protein